MLAIKQKFVLCIALLFTMNSFADELHTVDEIKGAIAAGKPIHIVIDHSQCPPPNQKQKVASLMTMSLFTPGAVMVLTDHIAASLMHFTLNNPQFLDQPVYEFVTYTIADGINKVSITYQSLNAADYTPLSKKASLNCTLGVGAKIYT